MKKIYVFGNEYLDEDNMALKVSKYLNKPDIKIIKCSSPDDLLLETSEGESILILDVVKNINEPLIIDDVSKLKVNKITSLHDFDVGYFLNLMKKLGLGDEIKIIGIPMEGDAKEFAEKVITWI